MWALAFQLNRQLLGTICRPVFAVDGFGNSKAEQPAPPQAGYIRKGTSRSTSAIYWMAKLSISVMGTFAAEIGDVPVTQFQTVKSQALLAYLAVEGPRVHERSVLAGLFWPNVPERTARNNLRQSLFRLRHALGDGRRHRFLKSTRNTIQLNSEASVSVDIRQFHGMLTVCRQHAHDSLAACQPCIRDLRDAVALYRSEFLAGFTSADSNGFEEWVTLQRTWLQRELLTTLAALTDAHIQRAEYRAALTHAREQIKLAPLQEDGHRYVMKLLALDGQKGAALEQYRRCVSLWRDEFGSTPSADMVALYNQIREGTSLLPQQSQSDPIELPPTARPLPAKHNLPATLSRLIGRQNELKQISTLLGDENCRMLTITGPIGVGKTTLAIHAANQLLDRFPDGVIYAATDHVQTQADLIASLANALNLPQAGTRWSAICHAVRHLNMLILLDGFDGIRTDVDDLQTLLRTAPQVKLLIAAPTRFNVRGEWTVTLSGLNPSRNAPEADTVTNDAVEMFLYHARRAVCDFELRTHEYETVAQICELVDGMPLGIELAANWVRVFTCDEILREIRSSFHFLTGTVNNVPKRHMSIASVVERTWQRLPPEQQDLLRACSAFRGPFARAAFEWIVGVSAASLATLIDRSLLERLDDGRFRMPEMLRQFAAAKLNEHNNQQAVICRRFVRYYANFLSESVASLVGGATPSSMTQQEAIQRIEQDYDNLQQAWRWAKSNGDADFAKVAAASLVHFYEITNRLADGKAWFSDAVDVFREDPHRHAQLLACLGWLFHLSGNSDRAYDMLAQATGYLKLNGQKTESVLPLCWLAMLSQDVGAVNVANDSLQLSLAISKTYDDQAGAAYTIYSAAVVAHNSGEHERARRLCEKSLGMFQYQEDQWRMAHALELLGQIAHTGDSFVESQRCFEDARYHYHALNNLSYVASCSESLGLVACAVGEWQQAQQYVEDALAHYEQLDDQRGIARSQLQIGRIYRANQQFQPAQRLLAKALTTAATQQWSQLAIQVLTEWRSLIQETKRIKIQLTPPDAELATTGGENHFVNRLLDEFMRSATDGASIEHLAQIDNSIAFIISSGQTNLQTLSLE